MISAKDLSQIIESMFGNKISSSKAEESLWRLSDSDKDALLSISEDGLSCSNQNPDKWLGGRVIGALRRAGKYYYEAEITGAGICRIGWSTGKANLDLGYNRQSFGFGGTGKKSHSGQFIKYGEPFTNGDVIGCYLDLDNSTVWWSKKVQERCRVHEGILCLSKSLVGWSSSYCSAEEFLSLTESWRKGI